MSSLNLYDTTIPALIHSLTNLSNILTKATTTASSKSLTPDQLISSRLIEDMQPFPFQVTSACNSAKFIPVRVAGHPDKIFSDDLTTFEQLQERISGTIDFLKSVDRSSFEGKEKEIIEYRGIKFTSLGYVTKFALPNFYFHVATAYGILRTKGIEVGKMDYLGGLREQGTVVE